MEFEARDSNSNKWKGISKQKQKSCPLLKITMYIKNIGKNGFGALLASKPNITRNVT